MSNHDTNIKKQVRWHLIPLIVMALGFVVVVFTALYEDGGGGIPADAETATHFVPAE